ncbi:MAG: cold shock and DUF1294 domain-containing protein [Proteobacteria bacterium]|uniref:cold shock and DUF1294 domain-containing protein n=1 Tax=Rudaea sp. TaxID=2136325 RepID=UPI00321F77BC|nr:cold shock and DUF1294 domain-containing protein [Pseudomonadota bacterium]
MRYLGRISEWRDDQGYGFITPNAGGERVFFHITAFKRLSRRPVGNELVNFVRSSDGQGRLRAEQVEYVALQGRSRERSGASVPLILFAGVFLATVGALALTGKLPMPVLVAYFTLSCITFAVYAWDKSAAQEGRWRTQESTLQLLALLGGWPGGICAQQVLRHKSRKESFQFVFWLAVAVNVSVFGWLLSDAGSRFLASLISG